MDADTKSVSRPVRPSVYVMVSKTFYSSIFRQFVKKCRNEKKVQKRNCTCLVFITVIKLTPYMILQGVMMKIDSYQNIMPGTAYRLVSICCIIF